MSTRKDAQISYHASAQSLTHGKLSARALVHISDGTRASRTGSNLKALCGANVRPDNLGTFRQLPPDVRICHLCEQRLLPGDTWTPPIVEVLS